MTTEEARAKMKALATERSGLVDRIEKAARAVVPVLLDAGRTHSAKELQELFFQLDVSHQALTDFITANPREALEVVIGGMGRDPR